MKFVLVFSLLLAASVAVFSQTLNPAPAPASSSPSWNYNLKGSDWNYTLCKTGTRQSPIELDSSYVTPTTNNTQLGESLALALHYHELAPVCNTKIMITNTGAALELAGDFGYVDSGSCCQHARYNVKRLVFHAPSEHTIDDKHFDLEMQIVHQRDGVPETSTDGFLIVSVMFTLKGTPGGNPFLQRIDWSQLPKNKGEQHQISRCVDLNLLTESVLQGDYYAYQGSLTTPGCNEGVEWRVLAGPSGISLPEIDAINALFSQNKAFANGNGNNRQIQAVNKRPVTYVKHVPDPTQTYEFVLERL